VTKSLVDILLLQKDLGLFIRGMGVLQSINCEIWSDSTEPFRILKNVGGSLLKELKSLKISSYADWKAQPMAYLHAMLGASSP